MIVVGIDPSLTQTAVVLGSNPTDVQVTFHRSKPTGEGARHRVSRYDGLVSSVVKSIRQSCGSDEHHLMRVFIEGYAYGAKVNREYLGEFGGILRWHLVDFDSELVEIAPMSLKKFTTGKGVGQKDQMMMHCLKNWGYQCQSSDDADAYSLFRLGLCVCGLDRPQNQAQRDVVGKIKF